MLGVDPKLAALADNGGATFTRAIGLDSPALDAGDPAMPGIGGTACEASDQRGVGRPQPVGGTCDIGAFELVYVPTTTTTTTTLGQIGCGAVPIAPTFASIGCRLAALLDRLNGESGLGTFQPKLVRNVEKAQGDVVEAAMLCAAPSTKAVKKAKKRLQQAAKAMTQYGHRLSGLAARKKLDEVLRESLIDAGAPIGADLKTLRGNLQCPGDAAGIVTVP